MSVTRDKITETAMGLFAKHGTTSLTVSELAQAAGVARGTIYNNFASTDRLFEQIAGELSENLFKQIALISGSVSDPAQRVANGIRYFVKQAHEQPVWGRFILRFAFSTDVLEQVWTGLPSQDLEDGLKTGQFHFEAEQMQSFTSMLAGCTVSAIFFVVEGHKTWREAGANAVEFVLRAVGVDEKAAQEYAKSELPPLETRRN
jgi:AcrR family transcriptional regulator